MYLGFLLDKAKIQYTGSYKIPFRRNKTPFIILVSNVSRHMFCSNLKGKENVLFMQIVW